MPQLPRLLSLLSSSLSGNLPSQISSSQNPKSFKNPSFSSAPMASSGSKFTTAKRSSTTTQTLTWKRPRIASPPAASTLPVSVAVIPTSLGGMGFKSLPPLPIISKTFGFLKCVNLSSVGLGLNEVPSEFGWDLVLWKPILEQSELKSVPGPSEV